MIIERLDLKAYGRFTNCSLSLDAGPRRFFLIVGDNESGKSTSLRAIGDWLFGFPTSTEDDYVHPMNKLRVGGRLVDLKNGTALECLRRKGNRATLSAMDGSTAIDDASLQVFLRGLQRSTFAQQFGISHQQLVDGGQQVVSGDGDLGELLFSAGAGVGRLRKLKEQLDRDTKAWMGDRANTTSRLGKASDEFRELSNQLRLVSIPQTAYDNLQKERAEALQQAEQGRELQRQLQQRLSKLNSIKLALPLFAQRDQLDSEQMLLDDVLPLMPDFSKDRSQAESAWTNATVELNRRLAEKSSLEAAIAEATVADDLLEYQAEITALYRDLGHYEEQQSLLSQHQLNQRHCREKIEKLTRDLRVDSDSLFTVDISGVHRKTLQALAKSHSGIVSKATEAKLAVERLEAEHQRATAELQSCRKPPVAAALSQSLRSLGKPQAILAPKEQLERKVAATRLRLDQSCRLLPGFDGSLEQAVQLKRPSESELRRASDAVVAAQQDVDRLTQEHQSLFRKANELKQLLTTLAIEHELSDLSAFDEWVAKRDELITRALQASAAGKLSPVQEMVDLQTAVREVDRLFQHQLDHRDQVVKKLQLEDELQRVEQAIQPIAENLNRAIQWRDSTEEGWQSLWRSCGVVAGDLAQMREWVIQHQAILDEWQELQDMQLQLQAAEAAIHHARAELIAALQSVEDEWDESRSDLCQLHARALQVDESLQMEATAYQNRVNELALLSKQLQERQEERKSSETQLKEWQSSWQKAIDASLLNDQVTPQSIDDLLQDYDRLAAARDEASTLESSISTIQQFLQQYVDRVSKVAQACSGHLATEHRSVTHANAVSAASELNRKLQRAKGQQDVANEKRKSLAEVGQLIADYQVKIDVAEATLARLCSESGCESRADLAEYERRATAKSELIARIQSLTDKLQALAPMQSLDPFREECESVIAEDLDSLQLRLQQELEAAESMVNVAQQTLGRLDAELKQIGSSSKAVDLRQELQASLAKMRRDADQFGKMVVARELLDRAIKRYQEQNQQSVLGMASSFFSQLTTGKYHTLKVDFDKDRPTLFAVGDQGEVAVPQLSDGTADALYLSFRLASLELHLKDHAPFPLIVDDCLIQFDDARAAAALRLFSDLSLRTQVIMFTHHEHLVQLAEQNLPANITTSSDWRLSHVLRPTWLVRFMNKRVR